MFDHVAYNQSLKQCRRCKELENENRQLKEGLLDPKKLKTLADWIDQKYNHVCGEVQRDLRDWANNIESIVKMEGLMNDFPECYFCKTPTDHKNHIKFADTDLCIDCARKLFDIEPKYKEVQKENLNLKRELVAQKMGW